MSINFMAAVTICSDFGAKESKSLSLFSFFLTYLPRSDGLDAMIFVFCMLSFQPAFFLSSFTFINRLFSSSSLYAIRVVSSAYLRLLIFLLTMIQTCASSSPAFHMMYSAYMLSTRVTIYSLDVLLSQFGTSPLFHVQFYCFFLTCI